MRFALLALLSLGPAHGYELKAAFETHFGAVWPPLNIGQVYTTLARLERDGLVVATDVEQSDRPNKRVYSLTGAGREFRVWILLEQESPLAHGRVVHLMIVVELALAKENGGQIRVGREELHVEIDRLGELAIVLRLTASGGVA